MNPEEIKVGETYNVRVRVKLIEPNRLVCQPLNQDGTPSEFSPNYFNFAEAEAFYPINAENDIKSAKNAQKYDPCRLFKKGDKVRIVKWNGRSPVMPFSVYKVGDICTVMKDEDETSYFVRIESQNKCGRDFLFGCLELVTPVEELERYHLNEIFDIDDGNLIGYEVARGDTSDAIFYGGENHIRTIKQAKEAAEAECAKLNDEWRKEQDND